MTVRTGDLYIKPWDKLVKIHCVPAGGDTYQVIYGNKTLFSVKAVETRGLVETAERKWREIFPQSQDPPFPQT